MGTARRQAEGGARMTMTFMTCDEGDVELLDLG
jgi:hypothetical protein